MTPPLPPDGLLDDLTELEPLVRRFEARPEVAFDCEGDGFFRYRANLCTVQLADRERIALVDTMSIDPAASLRALLGPGGPLKVVHDAAYDARLLDEHGIELGRVFDTSVAARFLGEPALGLGTLVSKYLGVELEKQHQLADWGRRPLGSDELGYMANDVRYLLQLADQLRTLMAERGITDEVEEESRFVVWNALQPDPAPRPVWSRIKGYDGLRGDRLAILRALTLAREELAEARDVPPFKVIRNEVLLAIARQVPTTLRELRRVRGVRGGAVATRLLEAVREGKRTKEVPDAERRMLRPPPMKSGERSRKSAVKKRLAAWRAEEAKQRGVDVQVVLPGHCLTRLVAQEPRDVSELEAIPGFGEFRVERYAEAILSRMA